MFDASLRMLHASFKGKFVVNSNSLSLIHLTRSPLQKTEGKPPLLLMLHGVGSHEADLFELGEYLDPRFFIVSARAPIEVMPGGYAWFNIDWYPDRIVIDFEEAQESLRLLEKFMSELIEEYEVDQQRVYLLGFSQGSIMSLSLALTRPEKVAGVVAMSGRLPPEIQPFIASPDRLKGLPIFIAHGTMDNVLPIGNARAAREQLAKLPVDLTYHEYPMAHQVSIESLTDIAKWLIDRLNAPRIHPSQD